MLGIQSSAFLTGSLILLSTQQFFLFSSNNFSFVEGLELLLDLVNLDGFLLLLLPFDEASDEFLSIFIISQPAMDLVFELKHILVQIYFTVLFMMS